MEDAFWVALAVLIIVVAIAFFVARRMLQRLTRIGSIKGSSSTVIVGRNINGSNVKTGAKHDRTTTSGPHGPGGGRHD